MSKKPVAQRTGDPCKLCRYDSGWGRDEDSGPCKHHYANKQADLKKKFLKLIRSEPVTMKKAAERVDRDPATIWRWRQADERFDEKVMEALNDRQQRIRVSAVEDAVFEQICEGSASGSLAIFWLKANGGRKYREADKRVLETETAGGDEDTPDPDDVRRAREALSPREEDISFNGSGDTV